MKTLAAMLCCLLLAACSASYKPGVMIHALDLRQALAKRHGLELVTHDDVYRTTTLDALWQANVDSWRHERGEVWDCEDNAEAMILQLRSMAAKRGDSLSPAVFLMPAKMRDGRRHAVIVALCHTPHGAVWHYWDASNMHQLDRADILHPLTSS